MAIKLTTTREAAKVHGVKMLVYGKAGYGKTRLCATAPNPIIISAESGLLSLRDTDIPVIEIQTVEDLSAAYNFVTTDPNGLQFATICLDSITEIAEQILSNAKKQVKDPRQAYGELIEKMTDTLKAFRDLQGRHIYFSAKQEPTKDELNGTITYGPSMPGTKLGVQLPYLFDEVFQLGKGKQNDGTEYSFLRTRPDFQYEAKDRSGALDVIEYPDLTNIINKITGATNHATT